MKPTPSVPLDDPQLLQVFGETSLWSAPFGQALLDQFRYQSGLTVLDIGCGSGFPAIEIAQRLDRTAKVIGLDPWKAAIDSARARASLLGLANVEFVEGVAEKIPLPDNCVDAIVSNNGLNNVADLDASLAECTRVSRPGAQLVLTVNLPDSMREFYSLYEEILNARGLSKVITKLHAHIDAKRKPKLWLEERLAAHGFTVRHSVENCFTLRYLNGTTLFNHFFIRVAFLEPWMKVVEGEDVEGIFSDLEDRLNQHATTSNGLVLSIPFLCIDARKK
jgi:arsenite methyltransferase